MLLSEDEQLLQNSARSFFAARAPISRLREIRDQRPENRVDRVLWREMSEMGWPAIPWPAGFGGLDFGYRGLGIVAREAGRTLVVSPMLGSVWLCGSLVNLVGTPSQKKALLPTIASGQQLLALAIDEQHKHHPAMIETTATAVSGGYRLNGHKRYVIDGSAAELFIVAARMQSDHASGVTLFLVPRATAGIGVEPLNLIDPRDLANLTFKDVLVSHDSAILGSVSEGSLPLDQALDIGRIGLAAEMLGSCEEALSSTIEYIKIRKQFGVPLGSFQSLKHRCADMHCQLELARAVLDEALTALDDGRPRGEIARLASMTKAKIGKCAQSITREAIQMHGGIAMTDELDIGFFLKRAAFAEQALGGTNFHIKRFAELEGY